MRILSAMFALGEDELICDFAETYGIYDLRALPVPLLATLAVGLREDSRIRKKINGNKLDINTLLLAMAVDYLGLIAWIDSGAAQKKRKRPASVADILLGHDAEKKPDEVQKYQTAEGFDAAWERVTKDG